MMNAGAESSSLCLVSEVTAADVRAIEAGLHELWRLAEAGEQGGAIVRAASMTVLVPVGDEAEADRVAEVLDGLAISYPSRAILTLSDEQIPEPRARLCSHCRRAAEGDPTRYWEEIRLVSSRSTLQQVMSLVAILALPSLPVQTWWPSEPAFEGDLFHHVVEVSDRIMLDSSRFGDPAATLPQLAAAVQIAHQSVAFADLSWTRLTPWRLLIAEFFDPAEDQAMLQSIDRVTIEYAAELGGEAAQALLLVGWLASRLGWEPRAMVRGRTGSWTFEVVDGVRPVRVEIARLERREVPERAGGVRSVTLEAADGDRQATYRVTRPDDLDEAHTLKDDGTRLEGRAHLPVLDEAGLLYEELSGFATDRIYQESLALVARLFGGS